MASPRRRGSITIPYKVTEINLDNVSEYVMLVELNPDKQWNMTSLKFLIDQNRNTFSTFWSLQKLKYIIIWPVTINDVLIKQLQQWIGNCLTIQLCGKSMNIVYSGIRIPLHLGIGGLKTISREIIKPLLIPGYESIKLRLRTKDECEIFDKKNRYLIQIFGLKQSSGHFVPPDIIQSVINRQLDDHLIDHLINQLSREFKQPNSFNQIVPESSITLPSPASKITEISIEHKLTGDLTFEQNNELHKQFFNPQQIINDPQQYNDFQLDSGYVQELDEHSLPGIMELDRQLKEWCEYMH